MVKNWLEYKDIVIPNEMLDIRKFHAETYYKDIQKMFIELDEDDLKIIDYSCTCTGFVVNRDGRGKKAMCTHLKNFEEVIKKLGYIK